MGACAAAASTAHASRQIDGQEWPELGLAESETALVRALAGRTLADADALSVFFALLPFGSYAVDGTVGDRTGAVVLQHDLLYGAPAVEYRVDLADWTNSADPDHRESLRYAIHTDPNYAEAGANGHARARLDVSKMGAHPSVTLRLSWLGQYHTKLKLGLNAKVTRVQSLEVSGPLSERPGFRPAKDRPAVARAFTFTDRRPEPFIDTDCDALLARLG